MNQQSRIISRRECLTLGGRGCTVLGLLLTVQGIASCSPSRPPSLSPSLLPIEIPGGGQSLVDVQVQDYIRSGTGPFWVAGRFLNRFASNLQFRNLDPELVSYYRRAGSAWRTLPGAQSIWETIPAQIRAQGTEGLIRFHQGKDWSHILPRSLGGSSGAENGIFEDHMINLRRGNRPMTSGELAQARQVIRSDAVRVALTSTARSTLVGTAAGVAIVMTYSLLEHGLRLEQGEITSAEFLSAVMSDILRTGATAFVVSGLITGIAMVFPSIIPILAVLAVPLAVAGFVLLGYQFYDLGIDWWVRLKQNGALDEYLKAMTLLETNLSSLDERIGMTPALSAGRGFITEQAGRVTDNLPRYDVASLLPDMEIDPGRYIPDLPIASYLPALDLDLSPYLPDLDIPWEAAIPNVNAATAAARSSLDHATAFLESQVPTSIQSN